MADVTYGFSHSNTAPSEARRALKPLLPAGELADDVALVTSELVSNVVTHTADGGEVRAWDDDPFRLEVQDTSPRMPEPRKDREGGGLGLRIVDELSSTWGTDEIKDGKVVWVEFGRPNAHVPESGGPPE